jgi:RNA polymerase sigma-70 factor, ECF subfamily
MPLHDSELIYRAREGDLDAFEQLVFRYDREVLTIAARFANNADDAKDIYQEVFLRVYQGLRKFQLRSQFSTWLYRITTNVCLTHTTKRKRHLQVSVDNGNDENESEDHRTIELESIDPSPHQQAVASELKDRVNVAMAVLSSQQRLIFTLKVFQGHTFHEIASMVQCSEGTVKKHFFIATRRLRSELKDYY